MGAARRIVIVGGGFGGLAAAQVLAGTEAQVTLVDRRNHHLFQPLLYQVATAALNPSNVATPIRRILRRARKTLAADFRHFDPREAKVILVEAAHRVLGAMSPESSAAARRQLERLGVEMRLGQAVTAIDADGVSLGDRRLQARTVLWAAGVAASKLGRTLGVPLDRAGRVQVSADLSIPGAPEVFVAGDLAALEQDGKPVPGVAPAAIQEGRHAARNALAAIRGGPRRPFRYRDKGTLATIGRAAAVADIGGAHLSGFFAWLVWLLVHIVTLIGFRNRLLVLIDWAWLYLTFERGARLITDAALPSTAPRVARAEAQGPPPGVANPE